MMSVWDIVKAAGIPALLVTVIVSTFVQIRSVKRGVQALLRDRLLQGYKFFRQQGWADEDDRMNLENVYIQYHNLGANGVMDDLRNKFLALPADPQRAAQHNQAQATPSDVAPGTNFIDYRGGIGR